MNSNDLSRYQLLGAQARLVEIQSELDLMYGHFPQLFPGGAIRLRAQPEGQRRGPYKKSTTAKATQTINAKAKQMVRQAELMRRAKKAKAKSKGPKRPLVPFDPTGETLNTAEAARLLGISESGVNYKANHGTLRIFKEIQGKGKHKTRVYLHSDVMALKNGTSYIEDVKAQGGLPLEEQAQTEQPQAEQSAEV